jgi:hypothetical protein
MILLSTFCRKHPEAMSGVVVEEVAVSAENNNICIGYGNNICIGYDNKLQ